MGGGDIIFAGGGSHTLSLSSLPCQSVLRPPSPMTGYRRPFVRPSDLFLVAFSRFFIALLSISLANLDPLPAPSTTSGIHSV